MQKAEPHRQAMMELLVTEGVEGREGFDSETDSPKKEGEIAPSSTHRNSSGDPGSDDGCFAPLGS